MDTTKAHRNRIFENLILDTPFSISLADRFKVTDVELVDVALLFILIVPVGGVVSGKNNSRIDFGTTVYSYNFVFVNSGFGFV